MSEKTYIQIDNEKIEAKASELDYLVSWKADIEKEKLVLEAIFAARSSALAKLAALGLTEEEIAAL